MIVPKTPRNSKNLLLSLLFDEDNTSQQTYFNTVTKLNKIIDQVKTAVTQFQNRTFENRYDCAYVKKIKRSRRKYSLKHDLASPTRRNFSFDVPAGNRESRGWNTVKDLLDFETIVCRQKLFRDSHINLHNF